jgi:hypothetical protein
MSESGLVSRVSPVQTALRNCTRDEGRSFEIGNQVLISSHRKLLLSKAMVVLAVLQSERLRRKDQTGATVGGEALHIRFNIFQRVNIRPDHLYSELRSDSFHRAVEHFSGNSRHDRHEHDRNGVSRFLERGQRGCGEPQAARRVPNSPTRWPKCGLSRVCPWPNDSRCSCQNLCMPPSAHSLT